MGVSGRNMQHLLLGLLLCVELGWPAANDNHHAFKVLCGLYRVAEKNVTLPTTVDLPGDLAGDIFTLNMSTAPDDWYNAFSGNPGETWDSVKDKEPFKTWAKDDRATWESEFKIWNGLKHATIKGTAGAQDKFARPQNAQRRDLAHRQIRRIIERFEAVRSTRAELVGKMQTAVAEIGKKFNTARFGAEDASAPTRKSFDGDGSSARSGNGVCGGNTGAALTGTSLANDLVCICTMTTSGATTICKTEYTHNGNVWDSNADSAIEELPQIVGNCPESPKDFKVTASAIHAKIARFWGALGRHGGSPAAASVYVLGGGAVASGNCVGGTAAQMCVNYKKNFQDASAVPKGIPWLKALESAATKLDELEEERKKIHALNARAENLRDAAWAAYDQARFAREDGAPAPADENAAKAEKTATAVPGTSGKAEEKSGSNTIQRFILPWTLLL